MPPQLPSQNQKGPRVLQGDLGALGVDLKEFVDTNVSLCQPDFLHICDGSDEENKAILTQLEEQGMMKKLSKYENWYVGWGYIVFSFELFFSANRLKLMSIGWVFLVEGGV